MAEKKIKVTLVKSVIGTKRDHRATIKGLGLRKLKEEREAHALIPHIAAEYGSLGLLGFLAMLFVTLRDLVEEVGPDAIRFMMVFRKNDAPLDFDFTLTPFASAPVATIARLATASATTRCLMAMIALCR